MDLLRAGGFRKARIMREARGETWAVDRGEQTVNVAESWPEIGEVLLELRLSVVTTDNAGDAHRGDQAERERDGVSHPASQNTLE